MVMTVADRIATIYLRVNFVLEVKLDFDIEIKHQQNEAKVFV